MKRKTLSQVKNLMRRALTDLVDPPPNAADQLRLRKHFGNRCCYCGADAQPRRGHVDHAKPAGGNGLGNLLLSCGECNGDEKRDMHWDEFLRAKCGSNPAVFDERHATIVRWFDANRSESSSAAPRVQEARAAAESAIVAYEAAYNRVRDAVVAARSNMKP